MGNCLKNGRCIPRVVDETWIEVLAFFNRPQLLLVSMASQRLYRLVATHFPESPHVISSWNKHIYFKEEGLYMQLHNALLHKRKHPKGRFIGKPKKLLGYHKWFDKPYSWEILAQLKWPPLFLRMRETLIVFHTPARKEILSTLSSIKHLWRCRSSASSHNLVPTWLGLRFALGSTGFEEIIESCGGAYFLFLAYEKCLDIPTYPFNRLSTPLLELTVVKECPMVHVEKRLVNPIRMSGYSLEQDRREDQHLLELLGISEESILKWISEPFHLLLKLIYPRIPLSEGFHQQLYQMFTADTTQRNFLVILEDNRLVRWMPDVNDHSDRDELHRYIKPSHNACDEVLTIYWHYYQYRIERGAHATVPTYLAPFSRYAINYTLDLR